MIEDTADPLKNNIEFKGEVKGAQIGNHNIIYNYFYYREEVKPASVDVADDNFPCPYRGLFHFGPNDADVFFGREIFIEELYSATKTKNFIPVLGPSGSGKSSVVLAGLVPKLQKEGHWQFTHFRPGSDADPFYSLAEALLPLYREDTDSTDKMAQSSNLARDLKDGTTPLLRVFSSIQRKHPNHRLLLIADQFEEIYTRCNDEEIRRKFLDCLLASLETSTSLSSSATVLVTTMRADFLGNALSYRPFADVLQNADVKLGPMNRKELTEVIEKPAQKLGVTFQAGLVERILNDVENQPGNLPLLEFALTQLWNKRTGKELSHKVYKEIGQVEGALARYADEKYGNLTDDEKEKVRRIFIQLVHPGEGVEDTRRVAIRKELGEQSWSLVKKLADTRLVVTSRNSEDKDTVEIVHEALIRNWGEMRGWMGTDRVFRIWQEQLRAAKKQWEKLNKDPNSLLRGAALVEAEEKLKEHREDLCEEEQEFIQASVELRDREEKDKERRKQLTISGLLSGLAVTSILAILTSIAWVNAEISEIKSLAQSSDGFLNLDGQKALQSSLKAAIKMQGKPWIDQHTRTLVELSLLNTVHNVVLPNTLGGHANSVNEVSFSPDGTMLASASADKMLKLWDTSTKKEIKTLIGHTNSVNGVSFSPDGIILASAGADNTVKLWNISTGKTIKTLTGHTSEVNRVSFSRHGTMLVSASADNTVKLWNISTGKTIKTLTGHTSEVWGVSFSRDGTMLASTSTDKTVKLWNTSTGKTIKTLTGHTEWVWGVSFSPDGTMLASASADNTVKLWNTSTGQEIKTLTGHKDRVLGVSFSRDGTMLASASVDKTVKLWNTSTGQEIKTLTGHTDEVWGSSFSRDGTILASASVDKTVKLWNTSTGQEIKTLTGHTKDVSGVNFSCDGTILASASVDKTLKLWDTSTGTEIKTLNNRDEFWGVSFSPDGTMLASASVDKTVKLWNTSTGTEIKTLIGHTNEVSAISFSCDGKMLASASADKTVKLWNTSTGQAIKTLTGHTDVVSRVSFSPDGTMLASASADKTVKLWNTSTGQEIKTLTGHTDVVSGVSFSPDGKILASASDDRKVKLWDTSTGQEIKTLIGHTSEVNTVSFSPDGKMLASASSDKTVKLWNTSTGTEIKTLTGHTDAVWRVNFSPDGKMLASASADNTVKLWRWDFDYLLKEGCNFMHEYFKTNRPDNESDKHLCDGVGIPVTHIPHPQVSQSVISDF
jgi:WD40 repeat protein